MIIHLASLQEQIKKLPPASTWYRKYGFGYPYKMALKTDMYSDLTKVIENKTYVQYIIAEVERPKQNFSIQELKWKVEIHVYTDDKEPEYVKAIPETKV